MTVITAKKQHCLGKDITTKLAFHKIKFYNFSSSEIIYCSKNYFGFYQRSNNTQLEHEHAQVFFEDWVQNVQWFQERRLKYQKVINYDDLVIKDNSSNKLYDLVKQNGYPYFICQLINRPNFQFPW